jgi:hypothetical protein
LHHDPQKYHTIGAVNPGNVQYSRQLFPPKQSVDGVGRWTAQRRRS